MPRQIAFSLRFILVPVLAYGGFILYGTVLGFFTQIISVPQNRFVVLLALLVPGLCAAVLISALLAYPLAYLYRKPAVTIALIVSFPVLLLRVPELLDPRRNPIAIAISAYEIGAYLVLMVGCTSWVRSRLLRGNPPDRDSAPGHPAPVES